MSNRVVLCIGSNLEPRQNMVLRGMEWAVKKLCEPMLSHVYETPEIHGRGPAYANAVVAGFVDEPYDLFNREIKEYEIECGRDDEARKEGRVPLDIDIVIWDGDVVRPKDFRQQFFQIGWNELNRQE